MKKRILFMGEKPLGYRCLVLLHDLPNVQVIGVCTRKESKVWWGEQKVRKFSQEKGIPIITRKAILDLERVDLIVSVLYPFIIEKEILDKAEIAAINLHQAPLPEYRGCNSASHAIINGEPTFGGTLHLMSRELDRGDVIEKRTFPIPDGVTARELYEMNDENCFSMFADNIEKILDNNYIAVPQDPNAPSRVYARDSMADKRVDLNWPFERIWNFTRGCEFPPFEPAYIEQDGRRIYLVTKTRWDDK